MNLTTITHLAEIIGAIVVVSGVIFGIIQIRQYQQQRQDLAAVQLVNSFLIPEFNKALRKVWSLPDDKSITELRELGEDWGKLGSGHAIILTHMNKHPKTCCFQALYLRY